jgi:hypothetical protein
MCFVETRNVTRQVTSVRSAGPFTLLRRVDCIAEIPNSLRRGTAVELGDIHVTTGS